MDAVLYAEVARLFSMAMKGRYPDVRIIACGSGSLGKSGVHLDSLVIARHVDYISPHHYQQLSLYGEDGVAQYGACLDRLAGWIAASANPDMRIFVSEWNLAGTDMRTGLFTGGFLGRLERTPAVEMAAAALFLRHTSATGWDNAFINFDQEGWFPAPNYVVFRLWREHYLPRRIRWEGEWTGLDLTATSSEDGRITCLKIVNAGEQEVRLCVQQALLLSTTSWEVIQADSLTERNTMEEPGRIRPERREAGREGNDVVLTVPPLSASVLEMRNEK